MKKEKQLQFAHLLAGFVLLLQGFNWFEKGLSISVSLYLFLACIFLLVAGLHKKVQKTFHNADAAFFLIEAAALLYAAFNNRVDGSTWLWIILGLIGIVYIVLAIVAIIANLDNSTRRRRKRKRIRSSRTV